MSQVLPRSERLLEMERLYIDRPYSDIEMAKRLGVNRSTVYRDRLTLETFIPFSETRPGQWRIDRGRYLSLLRVNIHEALAIYLALKRTARQTHTANPYVTNALEKIAAVLSSPMGDRLVQSAARVAGQALNPDRIQIAETITRAWVEGCQVKISYQSLSSPQPKEYLVNIYLVEPSIWNEGAYLIGHSDRHQAVTTFKIDRISAASLTGESYAIPASFDEQEILKFAWGIWFDDSPEIVRLRFYPGEAARRLQESIWHPTQQITDQPDGGVIWQAEVADWRELAPWVRGWGSACEALEPKELREAVWEEARRTVARYGGGEEE